MLAALAGLVLAATVLVDAATGAVSVKAGNEPVAEVLSEVRRVTKANLMVELPPKERRVTLDARFATAGEAIRGVARAAELEVEEKGNVFLVHAPHAKPAVVREPPKVTDAGPGRWRVANWIDYPVTVLGGDVPRDVTRAAEFFAGFERRAGFGLVVMPTLKDRAVAEYLEAREAYRAVLEKAKLPIDLRGDVGPRNVRIYLEAAKGKYYAELLFSTGEGGAEVAHFVFVVDVQKDVCEALYVFKTDAPRAGAR